MKRRLQNKISESSATLPVACVGFTILWCIPWVLPLATPSLDLLFGYLTYLLIAYFLIEATNIFGLLRVKSQFITVLFISLIGAFPFLHAFQNEALIALFFILSLFALFRSYDRPALAINPFHASLCLSIGSIFWPPLLLLAPLLLWCQAFFLRTLSWRCFMADIMGLILPYWFWLTAALLLHQLPPLAAHIISIIQPFSEPIYWNTEPPYIPANFSFTTITHSPKFLALALTSLLGLTGFIHYLRKNYDDKIQVRMFYYCFLLFQIAVTIWLILQPQYFNPLFPILVLSSVPAAGHFFALTHTWLTNSWFFLNLLLYIATTIMIHLLTYYQP